MMSRHATLFGWAAAGILWFGIVANAHAVQIPDQVFDAPSTVEFTVPSTSSTHLQQGVTAGLSGLLSRIDIFFAGTPSHDAGTPPGQVLFSVNIGAPWQTDPNDFETLLFFDEGLGPDVIEIDVSAGNILINPGDLFVIGLQSSGTSAVVPGFSGTLLDDHYPLGTLWLDGNPLAFGTSDLNFVTYVGLPHDLPIPEPSGLILLFLGLTGLRLAGMRRN